jgi:hypothetical protein
MLGNDEGHPLRIETVLLPERMLIEVEGQQTDTLVSQFVSYLDGRILEVALDSYAQADDGAVWYSARTCSTTTTVSLRTPMAAGSPARTARRG